MYSNKGVQKETSWRDDENVVNSYLNGAQSFWQHLIVKAAGIYSFKVMVPWAITCLSLFSKANYCLNRVFRQ